MNYDVEEAKYLGGHTVWLRFADGVAGEVDLSTELTGAVFEPLRDPVFFARFAIDPTFRTLVWPNGADFAPEFLRRAVRVPA